MGAGSSLVTPEAYDLTQGSSHASLFEFSLNFVLVPGPLAVNKDLVPVAPKPSSLTPLDQRRPDPHVSLISR
jgi:hypothetical protein